MFDLLPRLNEAGHPWGQADTLKMEKELAETLSMGADGLLLTFGADGRVIYEDTHGNRTDLGAGFSPVLTSDGRVALLRGKRFGYGDDLDCGKKQERNWVAVYDPVTRMEKVLFDRAVTFGRWKDCVFEQMQLSYDGSLLYLVSPVYATSGSLAIVSLAVSTIKEVLAFAKIENHTVDDAVGNAHYSAAVLMAIRIAWASGGQSPMSSSKSNGLRNARGGWARKRGSVPRCG